MFVVTHMLEKGFNAFKMRLLFLMNRWSYKANENTLNYRYKYLKMLSENSFIKDS